MPPLPFALPAVLEWGALRASSALTLVQIYDPYPVAAARAACILSREQHPQKPVVVLAELESDGLTADQWQPDALLALFEGVGASALILACASDPGRLSALLPELVARARIPVGVCLPHGAERELLPHMTSARLLLAVDGERLKPLRAAAEELDFISALPIPEDLEDELERPLRAVTGGQLFDVDPAIDIDADCDISDDDVVFARWLLEQEEENWGAIRVHVEGLDDLAIFDENQYMLRVPLVLASDSPRIFALAVRHFCGIALYDGTCDFDEELLERLHRKYGLVIL